ncbi:MAG: hypothetical protein IJ438_05530 [Clostridia bacterium]|nr:hypothetical protein [Clostridia bacterium]
MGIIIMDFAMLNSFICASPFLDVRKSIARGRGFVNPFSFAIHQKLSKTVCFSLVFVNSVKALAFSAARGYNKQDTHITR